ncbi:MAG: mechanosensitive ion channel family protein [Phycisphaerales bacterium]|nr:MAG: mechanosensitive ion channel family protein [Phycisphaerales bacterium]
MPSESEHTAEPLPDDGRASQAVEPDGGLPGPGVDAESLSPVPERVVAWLGWLAAYPWAQTLVALLVVLLVAWLAHLIVRRYVLRLVTVVMRRLPSWWAGVVLEHKVLHRLVPLVPTLIIARAIPLVPHVPVNVVDVVQRVAQATAVLLVALAFGATLNAGRAIYDRYPIARGRPIKGYVQVVKIVLYIAAGVLILATLMGESPWIFLSGLGAMTAVLLLIFRDTLLSLVAGIQLVNNDLIRVGDWIEMPQFNADGDVIDISLNVVQVRNWDKTITSIPTHKFLEHSFKNWRGMSESGGRRIKRPVHIDMTTIRFLNAEEIERFSRFRLLRDYISAKAEELEAYNAEHCCGDDAEILANARHLSNVGTFRAYISAYLQNHPLVHQEMTMLVRQLDPGPHGLPIELFLYINDTRWGVYENAQSDIFDHILSIAGEFGLRVFQEPAGSDLAAIGRRPARQ